MARYCTFVLSLNWKGVSSVPMACKYTLFAIEVWSSVLIAIHSSYHSSMLPSLFPYEGSTPVSLMKKSVGIRKRVVQVEVTDESSSFRERRSETPSPEDMTEAMTRSGK